jgi:hypothetical protein
MMDIELIEIDRKHWVTINVDGREIKRRGPFLSPAVAQAMVDHLRELLEIPKNDVDVDAANLPSLISNHEFIVDCARFAEGLVSEQAVRKKYRLDDTVWESLGNDDALVEKIEAEKLRRIRTGSFKREKSQQLVTKAPDILSGIMLDASASPKHQIDAAKTLDAFATPEPRAAHHDPDERFIITINLGNDEKLTFNKSIKPTPHDVDPNELKIIDHAQELIPMIAANKREENGGGQPL